MAFRSNKGVSLIEASPIALKKTGRFDLDEGVSYPSLADGRLYLRPWGKLLYVYDVRDPALLGRPLLEK